MELRHKQQQSKALCVLGNISLRVRGIFQFATWDFLLLILTRFKSQISTILVTHMWRQWRTLNYSCIDLVLIDVASQLVSAGRWSPYLLLNCFSNWGNRLSLIKLPDPFETLKISGIWVLIQKTGTSSSEPPSVNLLLNSVLLSHM